VTLSLRFSPETLAAQLSKLEDIAGKPARYIIAFSGGLDSTVLAHSLASLRRVDPDYSDIDIVAIHIDHGLQQESSDWSEHCSQTAAAFGIEFKSLQVKVQLESGKGPEASARDARYPALHAELQSDDWLLSAHHREDQAETLLLNLIRGSGPAGVAGIGDIRRFGPGWLVRPMLNANRADILAYAEAQGLKWVEDPSNTDRRFDRNFLRHEVLPRLKSRWPDIAARLQRSAGHSGEASKLLLELAEIDLAALGSCSRRLPIDGLAGLSDARQRNVIRYAIRDQGLSTPTALQLQRVMNEVIPAREDAQPLVAWAGGSVRRYRNGLYLLPETLAQVLASAPLREAELELGAGLGRLKLEPGAGVGVSDALVEAGLHIKPREGGEEIQPIGQRHTRKLKKLLQEEGVVPWMRDRLPLVYAGDRLVAVGDLWLADDAARSPGVAVRWTGRPALH
jgi:tRNA(Ile)-lysidine synthase